MWNKVTEEVQIQICAMVGVGCSLRAAARLAGCAESTVRNLLKRKRAFAARFRKAEQHRKIVSLRHVQSAGEKNWRAAAWLLERANPNEYAPPKPDVVRPHQIQRVLEQFGDILSKGISNPVDRREVQKRLTELTESFETLADEHSRRRVKGER